MKLSLQLQDVFSVAQRHPIPIVSPYILLFLRRIAYSPVEIIIELIWSQRMLLDRIQARILLCHQSASIDTWL